MRILASILLTIALVGCAQTPQATVTEMPSAQVDAPPSETNVETEMEAEAEQSDTDESAGQTAQPSAKPSADSGEKSETAEPSPSPSPTQSTEPAPTKTSEPAPTKTSEPAPTKTTEPSPTPTKTQSSYTMAQVAQRNSQSACWVVIDGMVYDLTEWIRSHPGGRGAILSLCGTDGTTSFNAQHGGRAAIASVLSGFKLGPLGN